VHAAYVEALRLFSVAADDIIVGLDTSATARLEQASQNILLATD
jgi:hypothetical protein